MSTELWRAHRQIMDLGDMLRRETQGNASRVSDQNNEAWQEILQQCCVLVQNIRRGLGHSGNCTAINQSGEYREQQRLRSQRKRQQNTAAAGR